MTAKGQCIQKKTWKRIKGMGNKDISKVLHDKSRETRKRTPHCPVDEIEEKKFKEDVEMADAEKENGRAGLGFQLRQSSSKS